MEFTVLPSFVRHPNEAAIIGRILAGYGELEFELAQCIGDALQGFRQALRVLFRNRGEQARILVADALLLPEYEKYGLVEAWAITRQSLFWCKGTRNQYAHCHWYDDEGGLFFTQIEQAAKPYATGEMALAFRHVDVPLLELQETYFRYTLDCLRFLHDEHQRVTGRLKYHGWQAPVKAEPPPRHNPPEEHPVRSGSQGVSTPRSGGLEE